MEAGSEAGPAGANITASGESGAFSDSGLRQALRHTRISIFCQDVDLKMVWSRNVPEGWSAATRPGAVDSDFLPEPVAERLVTAKRRVLADHSPERLEIGISDPSGMRWFDLCIDAVPGEEGGVSGVITTAVETTDQKRREQALRTLLREVSHRSKNLLAIIQSIATQTGRHSADIGSFLARFRGRLQSLAASQDLVTSSDWRGANLYDLLLGQVGRYTVSPHGSLRFEGERPWLNPNAALHIGLALHELAVNSVSFGALSRTDGVVTVTARIAAGPPGERSLVLTWRESLPATGRSADPEARQKRFGSAALERIVPASLNGVASLDIGSDALEYRLAIPVGTFEA
jgi:two-component sensor histidine kinase